MTLHLISTTMQNSTWPGLLSTIETPSTAVTRVHILVHTPESYYHLSGLTIVPSTTAFLAQIAPNNYALAANSGTLMQSQHPFACSVSGLRPYACPHVCIRKSRKAAPTPTNGSVLEAPQRQLSPMPLRCALIAICPYTTTRFACSRKTPTVHWKQRRPRPAVNGCASACDQRPT